MNRIGEYLQHSELSLAAYVDLSTGPIDPIVLTNADVGFTQAQAEVFAATYTVIDRKPDGTGLSVTLFEKIQPNADGSKDQFVAIRGTEITDIMDIATDVVSITLFGSTNGQNQYEALSGYVRGWMGSNNNKLRPGFTVTGHSLGGFLATTLALDFPGQVSHTYLYNSPGITGVSGTVTSPLITLWKEKRGQGLIRGFRYKINGNQRGQTRLIYNSTSIY